MFMNPISFPIVQTLYSPGIAEMSIIRNLHCFSNYCPGVVSIAGVAFITLLHPFKKTDKQHVKLRYLKCHSPVYCVLTLSFEVKHPYA